MLRSGWTTASGHPVGGISRFNLGRIISVISSRHLRSRCWIALDVSFIPRANYLASTSDYLSYLTPARARHSSQLRLGSCRDYLSQVIHSGAGELSRLIHCRIICYLISASVLGAGLITCDVSLVITSAADCGFLSFVWVMVVGVQQ